MECCAIWDELDSETSPHPASTKTIKDAASAHPNHADVVRLEHAVELFRLLGGGAMGDLAGLPESRLVVLPGTAHFVPPGSGVLDRTEWLLAMVPPFLDAPTPEAEPSAGGRDR